MRIIGIPIFMFLIMVASSRHAFAQEPLSVMDNAEAGAKAAELVVDAASGNLNRCNLKADVAIGFNLSFWQPGLDDDQVIKFNTEGLKSFNVSGNLVYKAKSFLTARYERPFEGTANQEQILKTNTSQKAGIERFTGGVKLDTFADFLFPEHKFLKKLLSIQYKYSKDLFFGEVTALRDFEFLPQDAVVDPVNRTASGAQPVKSGQKLSFKAEFVNNEISLPLWSAETVLTVKSGTKVERKFIQQDLRLGYFKSQWRRPSHGTLDTLEGKPIVSDTTFKTEGIFIAFEAQDPGSPGLNLDWSLKYGFTGKVDNAFKYKDADVTFLGVGINTWYNLYFGDTRDGLALTLGFLLDRRRIVVDVDKGSGAEKTPVRILEDEDDLYKIYANLSYRF